MGLSRLVRLLFWFFQYLEGDHIMYLLIADLIHTILVGDLRFILWIWCV